MAVRKLDSAEWQDKIDDFKTSPSRHNVISAGKKILSSYAKHYPTFVVSFCFFCFWKRRNLVFFAFFFSFLIKMHLMHWDIFTGL